MKKSKQHFVPQFYLRNFASNPARIHILNLPRNSTFLNAGLKDQCYKRKFYGKDSKVEDILSEIEGVSATIISKILTENKLPIANSFEEDVLYFFIALQNLRTNSASKETVNSFETMINAAFEDVASEPQNLISQYKLPTKDSPLFTIGMTNFFYQGIRDLKPHLIFSGNHRRFITSDNPVCKYNQYFEEIKNFGKLGAVSRGLQIFFPISPLYLVILYDKDIYQIMSSGNITNYITDNDVNALNLLQMINSENNIYFDCESFNEYLLKIKKSSGKFRNVEKMKALKFGEIGKEDRSQLIVGFKETPNIHLDLSFIKIKRSSKKIPLAQRITNRYRKILAPYDDSPDLPKKVMRFVKMKK